MSFDRLAPHYDWLEAFTAGARLQRARTAWLPALRGCRRILSVGEGHGRFAEACAAAYPDAELTCVEASARMLQRAQRRLAGSPARVTWQQSDVFSWQPAEKYDAIVTCFFLDCFTPAELATVIEKLSACARPAAVWLVADFAVPERGLPRWRARATHALMYAFFRRATALSARRVTPPDDLLRAHGFTLMGRRETEWGLLRSDLWQRG
jgi:trans-aconitate methyltransferase